ncbi:MAG TPA: hypothetical protein VM075_06440 [Anaerolineae bacterium]|nr:hypothetical protein [Anaerolineae bacterium]
MATAVQPFEATYAELQADIERYVDVFIDGLQSFFLAMPKGESFVEFDRFEVAYQLLKGSTDGFCAFSADKVLSAVRQDPLVLVVLRTILGFSPPELAYLTADEVDQAAARRIDKRARQGRSLFEGTRDATRRSVETLVGAAVGAITVGAPEVEGGFIHRLDKADTRTGLEGIRLLDRTGVAYEMLLYERFLGRPFATHRDAVSEKVGDVLEEAVELKLRGDGIPYHKAGVAERFEDMDQAPDFLVPHDGEPEVVIEAKVAEDDGTARDKVTRVQHLAEIRDRRAREGSPSYEVIACVDGRGFGIRREDVKKLLLATRGKLFALRTVEHIVSTTALAAFRGVAR